MENVKMFKIITILGAILLVPVFMWLQNNYYHKHKKPELLQQATTALSQAEFKEANVSLNHLDATLTGTVENFTRRKQAQKIIDDIRGVRARPQDNYLQVPGWLNLQRDNSGSIQVDGLLSTSAKSNLIVNALLKKVGKNASIDFQENIKPPKVFTTGGAGKLFNNFFLTKDKLSVLIKDKDITIKGNTTLAHQNKWQKDIMQYTPDNNAIFDTTLYASRFHLPGYKYQSNIDASKGAKLTKELESQIIYFDSGSTVVANSEQSKIDAIAVLINNLDEDVTFVAGGHADATGSTELNMQIAEKRAMTVLLKLLQQAVNPNQIEIVSFGATQTAGQFMSEEDKRLSRRVELLIK